MVFTCPFISKVPNPFTKHLRIVPSAPIRTSITITFLSHTFFSSLARSKYLSLLSLSFIFNLWSAGMANSTIWQVLFCWLSLGLVVWPRLGFDFSTDHQFLQSLLRAPENRSQRLRILSSLARIKYLSIFPFSFLFTLLSARTVKLTK